MAGFELLNGEYSDITNDLLLILPEDGKELSLHSTLRVGYAW